jgi:hypothetical protein
MKKQDAKLIYHIIIDSEGSEKRLAICEHFEQEIDEKAELSDYNELELLDNYNEVIRLKFDLQKRKR